jgi:hypothetical protein
MKSSIFCLLWVFLCLNTLAQAPDGFNYQGIARDNQGKELPNQNIGLRLSILQNSATGTTVYKESHSLTTNNFGLFNIKVGSGIVLSGNFSKIAWNTGLYFLKVEMDVTGGTNYVLLGTSQLISVPFAMMSNLSLKSVNDLDTSPTNELQTLSRSNDTIFLTNGGYAKLPGGGPLPSVSTTGFSAVSYRSATAEGNVSSGGNEFVLVRGICLATTPNPTLNSTVFPAGTGTGTFTINLSSLNPNTSYYITAFASNLNGTSYGNQLSFTTPSLGIPALSTDVVTNISTTTALSGGNVTDDGGITVTVRGICWSTSSNPTTANSMVTSGSGIGAFTANLTGLSQLTTYYVRAFATNAQGTAYGNQQTFVTNSLPLATITTSPITSISFTSAKSGGNVTNDGGSTVTSRGICWGTSPNPTTANSFVTNGTGTGVFTSNLTGLTPNTTYYVRAFAINSGGTVYGNQYSFTTLSLALPTLTTNAISGITISTANSGGNISSDGGSNITARGVCWDTLTAPTISKNKTTDGTGTGSYNSMLTGLTLGKTYYVRAYATNSSGTSYGNQLSFVATAVPPPNPTFPVIGTGIPVKISNTTASCGGYVSNDGGSSVTTRGVCWSINPSPTEADSHTINGNGLGAFSSSISGLSGCGTLYYFRAYATNANGTAYGNEYTLSSGGIVAFSTSLSNITINSVLVTTTITDTGFCNITQKGICWSVFPNPTITDHITTNGAGCSSGSFTSTISGLYSNITFYVRSYITNNAGTSYSSQQTFTTATPSNLYLGQTYAGGIIYYLDSTGNHGLVCSPSDVGYAYWGCIGTSISGTGTALGTGPANTAAIIAGCTTSGIAARVCDNLVLNGYTDWFLPSVDEMQLIIQNLGPYNIGSITNNIYSTSSQYDSEYYWACNSSIKGNYMKSIDRPVRAVRAF